MNNNPNHNDPSIPKTIKLPSNAPSENEGLGNNNILEDYGIDINRPTSVPPPTLPKTISPTNLPPPTPPEPINVTNNPSVAPRPNFSKTGSNIPSQNEMEEEVGIDLDKTTKFKELINDKKNDNIMDLESLMGKAQGIPTDQDTSNLGIPEPVRKTRLGRTKKAEEFLGQSEETPQDNKEQSKQVTQVAQEEPVEIAEEVKQGSTPAPTQDTTKPTVKNKVEQATKSTLGFFQSLILMVISGAILLYVFAYGWKSLQLSYSGDFEKQGILGVGIINGEKYKAGENKVMDKINEITTKDEVKIMRLEYTTKKNLVEVPYKELKLMVNKKDYKDLKFKKKGTLLMEIEEEKDGTLISYKVIELE